MDKYYQEKSMVTAYFLLFISGIFGGHRFYLGRQRSATALLLTTIASIFFIATFKSVHANIQWVGLFSIFSLLGHLIETIIENKAGLVLIPPVIWSLYRLFFDLFWIYFKMKDTEEAPINITQDTELYP
ncbi:TM2 domain-containing protein [uncultured Kiloniella sp.]|uniref:TM2 domain-containing protein n=1 Tax=uncultured Kiloniella sp. TaxID=1133091 RepID=UPI002611EB26|nr:TM2 domain-containing protein [uncultured Kiloniella sp.]